MREIKFRGRDGDDWYYGSLFVNECGHTAISAPKSFWMKPVNADTVGQYTGLHDADGREIYEGDILSNGHDTVAVSYSIEFAAFVGLYNGREDLVLNLDDCIDQPLDELKLKVLGNVYDNPDLLEVAHD